MRISRIPPRLVKYFKVMNSLFRIHSAGEDGAAVVLVRKNTRFISFGILLILLGLSAPLALTVKLFGIFPLINESLANSSSGALMMACFKLIALNTLRALPLYTGTLLLAQGLGIFLPGSSKTLFLIPLVVIPAAYELIRVIYGIAYDFGIPAISLVLAVILMTKLENMTRKIIHKILVLGLLLFGVEWLDIVPLLSSYGFGRGEISTDLKKIAVFLGFEDLLNITGLFLFIVCAANSFILAHLLSSYTKELRVAEQNRLYSELKLQTQENRSLREMQSLVHDLKTPLTTIQGLAGVLSLSADNDLHRQYSARIVSSCENMSLMISEMLFDDTRQKICSKELVEYAAAHVPELSQVNFCLEVPEHPPYVEVNRIKMSRALTNILDNALDAVGSTAGEITVKITAINLNVCIEITDNGMGILPHHAGLIWEPGFSTKNSSGFGLPFVREIVEKNGGRIFIENAERTGTKVVICLPEIFDHA